VPHEPQRCANVLLPMLVATAARRWLGVEHAFLTENIPDGEPSLAEGLADFVANGFLTLARDPVPKAQKRVYKRCIDEHRADFNWFAFVDIDEFIIVRDPCALDLSQQPITSNNLPYSPKAFSDHSLDVPPPDALS
jgi:hypothetical protein